MWKNWWKLKHVPCTKLFPSLPSFPLPFFSLPYSCSKRNFSFLSSILALPVLMKVSLYKGRHRQWVLSCTTQQLCMWWVGGGGLRIHCTGVRSDVLGAFKWNLFRTWNVPAMYSYTLSMACDLVLSPKTALQNCGMYSFTVKEAKLWLQPYPQVWQVS